MASSLAVKRILNNLIQDGYLLRWPGQSSVRATPIYLELVPDTTGSLANVP